MNSYPILAPDIPEANQLCQSFGLTRIDEPVHTPFLKWGQPLQLMMHERSINMLQSANHLKGHLLLKAFANHKNLSIFDATAGLLGDTQVALSLHHQVIACEQHPMLAAMIQSFCHHHHLL